MLLLLLNTTLVFLVKLALYVSCHKGELAVKLPGKLHLLELIGLSVRAGEEGGWEKEWVFQSLSSMQCEKRESLFCHKLINYLDVMQWKRKKRQLQLHIFSRIFPFAEILFWPKVDSIFIKRFTVRVESELWKASWLMFEKRFILTNRFCHLEQHFPPLFPKSWWTLTDVMINLW